MKKIKNLRLAVLTVCISLLFLVLIPLYFENSYLRFIESCRDFGSAVKVYATEVFELGWDVEPSVKEYSEIMTFENLFPMDFESFKQAVSEYFRLWTSRENFNAWTIRLGYKLVDISRWLTLILPIILIIHLVVKRMREHTNTKQCTDSKPLTAYKRFAKKVIYPAISRLKGYWAYLTEHKPVWKAWIILWIFNLNLASIIVEFFAFYLVFAATFPIGNLYVQLVKLIMDLQILLRFVLFPVWIVIGLYIFDHSRRNIAQKQLSHYEARNCGFINELPIVSITCGSMGKRKTTVITDMALSQEVMFRQKALEILQKADIRFPYFPWLLFEKELQKCMEYGNVYNLATVKEWVKKKRHRFAKHGNAELQLYGYDHLRYGTTFDDCLKQSGLFDVLETYAKAYFIYITQSSLIMSNYSIRTDNELVSLGNFPMWNMTFFPKDYPENDRFAHILDFDVLRLGRKVMENNKKAGSFEFGVVAITEIGKERGNNLELREVKKGTDETNQKNDLFNAWIKMCRHSATVDNFPFIKVFTDEQRPESWGADARDLCDVINIASTSKQKLAMPFYTIEEGISEWLFGMFVNLYTDFRYRRGDNTLLVHLFKSITAFVFRRNMRIYNRFGYSIAKIEKMRGTMDGNVEKKRYYLMNRKIYSRRFSTDCFSDYFNEMAKNTKVSFNDYLTYSSEKATVTELKQQNSYFINALYSTTDEDN